MLLAVPLVSTYLAVSYCKKQDVRFSWKCGLGFRVIKVVAYFTDYFDIEYQSREQDRARLNQKRKKYGVNSSEFTKSDLSSVDCPGCDW